MSTAEITTLNGTASKSSLLDVNLSASVIRTDEGLEALREEWTLLMQNAGCANVFLSFQWMSQWWRHLGHRNQLFVVSLRGESGRLVALAPLYISIQASPLRIRRLGFLGDHLVGSDYLDIFADSEQAPAAVRCLSIFLLAHKEEWDYIDLADTITGSHTATLLAPELEARRLKAEVAPSSLCPYVTLPDSPDAYLATLGPKVRKHLKYYLRTLQRLGEVEFVTAEHGPEIEQAFDELLRLHRLRFRARGSASAFLDPRVASFHRAVLQSLSEVGSARIHLLKLRGEPVAAVYVLSAGTRTLFYQSGMDPEYGRYSIGSLLIRFAIEDAIRNQCTEFDFLRGDESYKSQWANSSRQMQSVRLFDDRLRSRIARTRQLVRTSLRTCKVAVESAQIPAKVGAVVRNLFPASPLAPETVKQRDPAL